MINIIIDTEFNSRAGNFRFEPISIALVSECGQHEFYEVSSEFNHAAAMTHPFLPAHVLSKLPPQSERKTNAKILDGIKKYIAKRVRDTGDNMATFWARNGGLGDFTLLELWFEGRLYDFMNEVGVRQTKFRDMLELIDRAGNPVIPFQQDPSTLHNALEDARHEQRVFVWLKALPPSSSPKPFLP